MTPSNCLTSRRCPVSSAYQPEVTDIGALRTIRARRAAVVEAALQRAGAEGAPERCVTLAHEAATREVENFGLSGYGEISNRLCAAERAAREVLR